MHHENVRLEQPVSVFVCVSVRVCLVSVCVCVFVCVVQYGAAINTCIYI